MSGFLVCLSCGDVALGHIHSSELTLSFVGFDSFQLRRKIVLDISVVNIPRGTGVLLFYDFFHYEF